MAKLKKIVLIALVVAMVALVGLALASCSPSKDDTPDNGNGGSSNGDLSNDGYVLEIETVYTLAKEAGFTGTLEDLIELFKGAQGEKGEDGIDGNDGVDGKTPYIGENGNWWIDEIDTGVKAASKDGIDGKDGVDGKTPYIGENGNWWIEEIDIGVKATCKDGNGIEKIEMNANGEFVVTYTDGTTQTIKVPECAHDYVWEDLVSNCDTHWQVGKCNICGDIQIKLVETPVCAHNYVCKDLVSNCTTHWQIGTCSICGDVQLQATKADGNHLFIDNICAICGVSCSKGLQYTLNSDGESYSVTGIGSCTDVEIYIPSTHNRLPVTYIGSSAFSQCSGLTSVTIPYSVTSVGDYAFSECSGLTSITIPNTVTYIGKGAFEGCIDLTSAIIGNGLSSISANIFCNCSSLTSIIIPDGVTFIGANAFSGCSGLTSISIPNSITSIGMNAFQYCYGIYNTYDNAYYLGNSENPYLVLTAAKSSINSCSIHSDCKVIYNNAFYDCWCLTSITIPNSVISIGEYAFTNCYRLVEIYNQSDLEIEAGSSSNGYIGCRAKNVYTPTSGQSKLSTDYNGFVIYTDGDEKILVAYTGKFLTTITIPDTITGINDYAFYWEGGVTSITIPNSVTSIGNYAFYTCRELKSITIPNGVTSIGNDAFFACYDLTSVTIGNSVTSIGEYAFMGCNSLTSVYITDIVAWYKIDFNGLVANPLEAAKNLYLNNELVTDLIIPNGVTSIGNYAFINCSSLTSIIIPDSVTSIGSQAFSGCRSLTSINIPDSVTSIGSQAFSGCRSLTSINIPDSVTSIDVGAFSRCSGLTSINIPNGIIHIYDATFFGCSGLTSITIPNSVTSICSSAFSGCSGLTSITIPNSVTSIHGDTFSGCIGLTSIVVPDSVTSIGHGAFEDCSSLTSITLPFVGYELTGTYHYRHFGYIFGASDYSEQSHYIPSSLTTVVITGGNSIGSYAFYNCNGLTSITIPNSVTYIGWDAFNNCSSITSIIFNGTEEEWNAITFGDSWNGNTGNYTVTFKGGAQSGEDEGDASGDASDDATYSKGLVYTLNDDGESYSVTGIGTCTDKNIVIPSTYNDLPVTSIGYRAFVLCTQLTSITIPKSITYIGGSAFSDCTGLTSVTIPNGVIDIGSHAFYYCTGLTSVTIPNSIASIGDSAFYGCSSLTSIIFKGPEEKWRSAISFGNRWNENTGNYTITFAGIDEEDLIGQSLAYVLNDDGASYSVSGIGTWTNTDIVIPSTYNDLPVTGICEYAFNKKTSWNIIRSITIPSSITYIGWEAFSENTALTKIYITDIAAWCNISFNGTLSNPLAVAHYVSRVSYLYLNNQPITDLIIPDSVTSICSQAFEYCTSLTSVTIPNSVTSICSSAFSGCSGLASITIPNCVTTIGPDAFYNCTGLTSVTMGNGVTSIGSNAFKGCNGLTGVYITDITAWCNISFDTASSAYANPLTVANNIYLNDVLVTDLIIPNGVTSISDYAFYNCTGLTSVTIPDSVTSIGKMAFYNCTDLASITFNGTEEEWNAISFGDSWDANTGNYTITFTDSQGDENESDATN